MRTLFVHRLLFRNFTVAAAATLLSCAQVTAAQIDASASFSLDRKKSQMPSHEGLESKIPGTSQGPFAAGKRVVTGYGSAGAGKASHRVYAGHVGLGYYLVDNLALNIEGVGYFVDHAHNSAGGGLDLLPRWHYLAQDNWSMYLDGGCGFIYTSDTLSDPGTHFNFTLQGGAGATYNLTDRLAAMFGARWFHISNARIRGKNRNVGLDSPIFYVGVMSPF
jgi:opacity protein-like surface antigen